MFNTNWQHKLNQLIIYRDILNDEIIQNLLLLEDKLSLSESNFNAETTFNQICHQLLNWAVENNINGNLWSSYILFLISHNHNPYSLNSEQQGTNLNQSLRAAAQHDLEILQDLYQLSLSKIAAESNFDTAQYISDFATNSDSNYSSLNKLAEIFNNSTTTLAEKVSAYYFEHGTGKLGHYKAFHWHHEQGLKEVPDPDPITFEQLIGYQQQQKKLIANTESFLAGHQANNALLVGDSGTGKSSSIKALMNKYYQQGLRLVELAKYQMKDLPNLLEILKDRGLYFIIFMDDLSFEDFEVDYKYLKAVLEGGLEVKPDNVIFYATSNRSHLISEKWEDRGTNSGEIHPEEAKQEKLSLAQRFGITIRYQAPDQDKYLKIVKKLAQQQEIELTEEKLLTKAKQWAQWENGRSGRTAQQFINSLK